MSKLLAIDTSTEACSVALNLDGELRESFAVLERRHAAQVLLMVQTLLVDAGLNFSSLDAVAFGRGPGSFTGLRIAAGVAQGMAFAAQLPVVPVSTLAALALQARRLKGASHVLSCLDARIGEVYWGYFLAEEESTSLVGEEGLSDPVDVSLPPFAPAVFVAGSGGRFRESMSAALQARISDADSAMLPRAGDMARLAAEIFRREGGIPPEEAAPVYIRDKVARERQG